MTTISSKTEVHGASLDLQGLNKYFGAREVLRNTQLNVTPGQFIAIVGRSGCGKSTLLRLVAGLEQASAGQVRLDGQPLIGLSQTTRIMFQEARLLPWKRVIDNVALARALVHQPRLLLLDEPLGALDALTRVEMHRLIEDLWLSSGFTALLVTHDVQEAVALADRVILIEDGRIALDEVIDLPRPRSQGDAAFAALEKRILDRVLQKPAAPGRESFTHSNDGEPLWPGVPAHGVRWAV